MSTGDRVIRWAAAAAVVAVAAIAAVISYGHAYELVHTHGETGATARALPLTIDGLIATCSLVLLDAARRRYPAPVMARVLLWAGIAATISANISHGLAHGPVGAVIAGWPAAVAVGGFEVLARMIRGGRDRSEPAFHSAPARGDSERRGGTGTAVATPALDAPERSEPAFKTAPVGAELNGTTEHPAPVIATPAPDAPLPVTSDRHKVPPVGRDVTAQFDAGDPVATAPETGHGRADLLTSRPVRAVADLAADDQVIAAARETFAAHLAAGAVPSVRAIRRELKVGHPKGKAIREALAAEGGEGSSDGRPATAETGV